MSRSGMNLIKLSVVTALVAALIATPATAYADDPVPTVDQVVAILAELTDPNRPAASKTDVVTPGLSPDEAGTVDDHLHRMDAFGGLLPPNFVVTDIQPAPGDFAGATVATSGGYKHATHARSIVLINQGGHWLITNDTAMPVLDALWDASQKVEYPCRPLIRCGII
jgi:hypothetical protein